MSQQSVIKEIFNKYPDYRENSLDGKRIDYKKFASLLRQYNLKYNLNLQVAGNSVEEREIFLCRVGTGPINVLAWSQMHGDESTATRALFDLINFLFADDEFNSLRSEILNNISFYFIPMLNPDGAEKFTRRNALQVDLNRDALRLQFPESRILMSVRDSINPVFGFNLHDQSQEYSAGLNKKPAVISVLAPPFNYARDLNDVRERAMKLIVKMGVSLQNFIPDRLGRYSDEFEPRAFGDNFVKKGTSTVLIESGWYPGDREKLFVRKINFVALIEALCSIADKSYEMEMISDYSQIPENQKLMFDLLFRDATIEKNNKKYLIDIGVNLEEKPFGSNDYLIESNIEDIGDLSIFNGYQEYDCRGLTIESGKIYPDIFKTSEDVKKININEFYKEGYIYVIAENVIGVQKHPEIHIILLPNSYKKPPDTAIDSRADFIFIRGEEIIYVVVNGFVIDLSNNSEK